MSDIEQIEKLITNTEALPDGDMKAVKAVQMYAEMVIRNIFGDTSHYLGDLWGIEFWPSTPAFSSPHRFEPNKAQNDAAWRAGVASMKDLFQVMLEEQKQFPKSSKDDPAAKLSAIKATEPITLDLKFVSSNEVREILQRDIAELNIARSQGLDKTSKLCMVLCGSIVEALLLDRLLQNEAAALAVASTLPKKPSSNLEDWDLYEMVIVATRLGLLPDDASTGATQLRQWRNLIHPGRELKDARSRRIKPTAARARNSVSFLQFIAEELGR